MTKYTAPTPISFSLSNLGTNDIVIRYLSYVDNAIIHHVSDYTNFSLSPTDERNITLEQYGKQYEYGDWLEKTYLDDTSDRTLTYTTMTGSLLKVNMTDDVSMITAGWTVTTPANGLAGRTVVGVDTITKELTMDGTFTGTPTIGGSVKFHAPAKKLKLSDTTHLQTGWRVIQNGYVLADNVTITAIDGNYVTVTELPNQTTADKPGTMLFFNTTTNYLTLNNSTNLDLGFTAKSTANSSYNDTQSIIELVAGGKTVRMSAPPNATPGGEIIFTSDNDLYTIPPGSQISFTVNYYTNGGPPGLNYNSTITVYAKELLPLLDPSPIVGKIYNFVTVEEEVYIPPINPPPPVPPGATPIYVQTYTGNGGGNNRTSYITTQYSYSDGSTLSITTNSDGQTVSINSTPSTVDGGGDVATSSVSTFGTSNPDGGGGGGGTGGGSRVICTHFYRKGMMPRDVWRADMEYTFNYLSPATVRGYQYWAIPYVRLMRESPLAEKIMYPLMMARAEELAYKMGVLEKANWSGKLVRLVFEPICFAIGLFVGEQNWKSLWNIKMDRKI